MCGVNLIVTRHPGAISEATATRMTDSVAHRGPDGRGLVFLGEREALWVRSAPSDARIVMGHRRLAILDLTESAAQPMGRGGSLWITYNGEVYNYVELRRELELLGQTFRSRSDTEVILAAYETWGVACFERFVGMWGLVLIDTRRGCAVVSRDRLGIKPLYLHSSADCVAVVSEIKQLAALPAFKLRPVDHVLAGYLLAGYEDHSNTFFDGVVPIQPGTCVEVDLKTLRQSEPRPYWFPERVVPEVRAVDEASRLLGAALQHAVRVHMRSDVPVGCALSGGLDSSAIASLIPGTREDGVATFKTFSAVFPGFAFDESSFVAAVAQDVGATPAYVTPNAEAFLEDWHSFVWHHDEPVGSLSQYAGFAVARLTRQAGIPVTLNGQGGDEVLSGYWQNYFVFLRSLLSRGRVIELARHWLGALLPRGNEDLWRVLPQIARRYWIRRNAQGFMKLKTEPTTTARSLIDRVQNMADRERRIFDIRELMLPRLLKWDDRNFMAFSVEGRYPFLDHRLIETCLSFDMHALYVNGWVKEPLRRYLEGRLPASVVRRKAKVGFETPQADWFRGTLKPVLEHFLVNDSPLWDYIEPTQAREIAGRLWSGEGDPRELGQAVFRIFNAHQWMMRFELSRPHQ